MGALSKTINFSLHIELKKAAVHINKCFEMSLKRKKTKKGNAQPQIHLGEESMWGAEGSLAGL